MTHLDEIRAFQPLLVSCILFCLCSWASAQSCAKYQFANNQVFSACNDLPFLNSYLHWTYNQSSKTCEIAFRQTGVSSSTWVSWAINPTSQGMVGAQALVAFQESDGTIRAYTSPVTAYRTALAEGKLSFPVSDLTAIYADNEIIIFARLELQNLPSTVNHVWQEGPLSSDNSPKIHGFSAPNFQSKGTLNLISASQSGSTTSAVDSRIKKKNIHGVLNVVSWGILMPVGALIARYLKLFPCMDPAWFYLHVFCQLSAYIIGAAGWATGLQLGSESPGVQHTSHRMIGIILFCLATVQISALFLRPGKDHKRRFLWNVFHYTFAHAILVLGNVNIFKGFNIQNPEKKWPTAYIAIIVVLLFVLVTMEAYTFCTKKREKSEKSEMEPHYREGA